MRLFVAVTPPPRAREDLRAAVTRLQDLPEVQEEGERYRWTTIDQWHVTLAFLGEVDDRLVPELQRRLTRAAARYPELRLQLASGGGFSSRRRARVLWTGVRGDVEQLGALARSVAAGARRAKVEVDSKARFRAHLTVARLREPTDVTVAVEALDSYEGPWWRATNIALIRSRLGQASGGRAAYETVSTHALGEHGDR